MYMGYFYSQSTIHMQYDIKEGEKSTLMRGELYTDPFGGHNKASHTLLYSSRLGSMTAQTLL